MIPDVLEQYAEIASTMWSRRDHLAGSAALRLAELERLDERIEAQIDGLRIAGEHGRSVCRTTLTPLTGVDGGAFFAAGVLAIESGNPETLTGILQTGQTSGMAASAIDPWRALVSALAWAEPAAAAAARSWLLSAGDSLQRWLGVAGTGASRATRQADWQAALHDPAAVVRARAYRATGELGGTGLAALLRPGLTDPDPECRFWSAWAASRMGAGEAALGVLAEIAWTNQPRATQALDLLLRCLEVPHANAWLREFARLPDRQRDLIRATAVVGDPVYIPWLIERMLEPETALLAGEAFSAITGLDLAHHGLDRKSPRDFESGPNDDPADENVAFDEDDQLPWPDPGRIGSWWLANLGHYKPGTAYFLGTPKLATDWLGALSNAFQRQRRAAALELAIRMPRAAMFEVRARGRLQRRLIARSRGLV
ncbi:MAG TPA: TIGR02270 family protein [Acetobacteraceae bacterium]|nr:TIGR02270 family protein [Acetobacteraceae bacterium]